ncbi:MAG: SemiSWEET family sugar transporter [Methanoculleus sp.]
MDGITALGLIAGALTTLSFAPQVARAWRTRSTADLSPAMLIIFLAGILLWLVYGIIREDLAIIAANGATAILISLISNRSAPPFPDTD